MSDPLTTPCHSSPSTSTTATTPSSSDHLSTYQLELTHQHTTTTTNTTRMSPKKAGSGAGAMKQSKLDFSAGKRTGSMGGAGMGKPYVKTGVTSVSFLSSAPAPAPAPARAAPDSHGALEPGKAKSAALPEPKPLQYDDNDHDEIEPADDEDDDDVAFVSESESVSSVTTFETVEDKPFAASAPVDAHAAPLGPRVVLSQGRVTRSQAAAAAAAVQNGTPRAKAKPSPGGVTPKKRKVVHKPEEEVAEVVDEIESAGDMDVDAAADAGVDVDADADVGKGKEAMFKPLNAMEKEVARRVEVNSAVGGKESPKEKENKTKEPAPTPAPVELRVRAVKWRKYHDKLKQKYGDLPTIHGEKENKIHQILRYFDEEYAYGPCVGVTRRQRWNRAHALGLNPPKEIDDILNTIEGRAEDEYVHSVFYGQV